MKPWFGLLIAALVLLAACGNDMKKQKPVEDKQDSLKLTGEFKVMGSQTLYPMMVKWSSVFIESNPGVKMIVRGTASEKAMRLLETKQCQMAMISRPLTEEEKSKGFFAIPVALDVVVPIFNFENNHIQPLVMKGVSRANLSAAFTGKSKQWGALAGRSGKEPIKVYSLDDSSGTAVYWSKFLGINPADIKGQRVGTEAEMIRLVSTDPDAIGYCSALGAYDPGTGLKKSGIYVLPVDFNANGTIEDLEQHFDKYSQLSDAVMNGTIPSPPVRELYVVTLGKPQDPTIKAFFEWLVTIGQNYMPEMGFIHLQKDKAQQALSTLK